MEEFGAREEEISLREIIEIILDGKWLIAVITFIAVVTSGILSYFVLNPVYEARTTLVVNNLVQNQENAQQDSAKALLEILQKSEHSVQTYSEQVTNANILKDVIDKLNLDSKGYTVGGLQNAITVETVKDTNLIRIKVKGPDPKTAADIANALAYEFVNYITAKKKEQFKQAAEYINDQLEAKINSNSLALNQVKKELAKTPEKLVTMKTLADEPFLQSVAEERRNLSSVETGSLQLRSEEINPVYVELQTKITELTIETEQLKAEKQSIQALTQKYMKEDMGKASILLSKAVEPENPVAPKKLLNIAIAGVVGIMTSVMIVFFRHYWRMSGHNVSGYNQSKKGEEA
ncbi:hypothetical protein BSNK01_17890 [Bacillaceae bacterium]